MTYRERREARLAKRLEWAAKRQAKSEAAFTAASKLADSIPMGQPILVGHHSEAHARRDADRIDANMRKGCDSADMAKQHSVAADTIEHELNRSIYSDDPDALDALAAKVADLEASRERMKLVNAAHKAFLKDPAALDGPKFAGLTEAERVKVRTYVSPYSWLPHPIPPYGLTNLGATIRATKKRIDDVKARQARTQAAKTAGGVMGEGSDIYVSVTFAEKPTRAVIDALKAAGFHWSGGSWRGYRAKLPPEVTL